MSAGSRVLGWAEKGVPAVQQASGLERGLLLVAGILAVLGLLLLMLPPVQQGAGEQAHV